MRKKIAAAALCVCLAASLTACQRSATETQADSTAADTNASTEETRSASPLSLPSIQMHRRKRQGRCRPLITQKDWKIRDI